MLAWARSHASRTTQCHGETQKAIACLILSWSSRTYVPRRYTLEKELFSWRGQIDMHAILLTSQEALKQYESFLLPYRKLQASFRFRVRWIHSGVVPKVGNTNSMAPQPPSQERTLTIVMQRSPAIQPIWWVGNDFCFDSCLTWFIRSSNFRWALVTIVQQNLNFGVTFVHERVRTSRELWYIYI